MWRIGIDEAGYGPNLGPFVMSATACRVPDELAEADLWKILAPAVGRVGRGKAQHLLVDDSKKVYRSGQGLAELERTTLCALSTGGQARPETLGALLARLGVEGATIGEPWYQGAIPLPSAATEERLAASTPAWEAALIQAGITWGPLRSVVMGASRFNAIVDRFDSKGAVLAISFLELLTFCLTQEPIEDVIVVVDKHGGRNKYGAMLQELSPEAWVLPYDEGMERSHYVIRLPDRKVTVTFRPEADATSFEVALASIVSKCVRELCMDEFNAYWQTQVPGVKPTAGYPLDAGRFLAEIKPTLERLALPMDSLWRKR